MSARKTFTFSVTVPRNPDPEDGIRKLAVDAEVYALCNEGDVSVTEEFMVIKGLEMFILHMLEHNVSLKGVYDSAVLISPPVGPQGRN